MKVKVLKITLLSIMLLSLMLNFYFISIKEPNKNDTELKFGIYQEDNIDYFKFIDTRLDIDKIQRYLIASEKWEGDYNSIKNPEYALQFYSNDEIGTVYFNINIWNINNEVIWQIDGTNQINIITPNNVDNFSQYLHK